MDVFAPRAKETLQINTSNYVQRDGYSLKVVNTHGNTLFETPVTEKEYEVEIHHKAVSGNIFLEIIDNEGNIIDVTKVR